MGAQVRPLVAGRFKISRLVGIVTKSALHVSGIRFRYSGH